MKLGVFDSGIGGEAIANSLHDEFPEAKIVMANDKIHMPYGSRSAQEIITLTDSAIQPLIEAGCEVIVIACNTATTTALPTLRAKYVHQKFIGIEPMVKPAASATKSGIIAVCATPLTLASRRYTQLKRAYANNLTVIEPDCADWAYLIENHAINQQKIENQINNVIEQGADVIVLGCTHYHWIKDMIEQCAKSRAIILEPSSAIAARVKSLLSL